ncbi:hypothetical protein J1N35_035253 [Gossypium stocksii]|uniref:Uncharacterized protein n=1 Tax=Gossypium stocksii TaxID=47602 RepID=A0A9D3ZQX4_9ROSI|nr:hypothetical protein J1N35_035253 [Gossypium stocksii]
MKESETIKEYSDRLLGIVNNDCAKAPRYTPERFQITIASLENMKNPSTITLAELLNTMNKGDT